MVTEHWYTVDASSKSIGKGDLLSVRFSSTMNQLDHELFMKYCCRHHSVYLKQENNNKLLEALDKISILKHNRTRAPEIKSITYEFYSRV